jgi:hypothetical protein
VSAIAAAVAVVYRDAVFAYLVEDDFHWFADARRFAWGNLLDLERYGHFYRPVIEVYFFVGQRLFGCAPLPFHLASLSIHFLNTATVFLFARRLSGSIRFAALAVLLFALQPGYVQAVAWVAAITDLLGAFWYLLTLLLYLRFLQTRESWVYGATLGTFTACLLTHESAATLLPMMIALETLLVFGYSRGQNGMRVRAWLVRYAPFAVLLAGFLVIAYVVNSRSYLVQEGYYAIGFHIVRNLFDYVVALYVGRRTVIDYSLIVAAVGALLLWGTNRMRFLVLWILITLSPALLFTWGIASRYTYVPAAGFALLLADVMLAAEMGAARWIQPHMARIVFTAAAVFLAIRFAAFAQEGSEGFRALTAPYEQLVTRIRSDNALVPPDRIVYVDGSLVAAVPEIYRNAVAETALCTQGVRLAER